jgi:hypothetical protein
VRSRHPGAGIGWGEYNSDYIFQGGTSMATPLAAGAAALVREWLTRVKGVESPSAALLRSLLINGAVSMSPGQYGSGATREILERRPNTATGWGRVDLIESLAPPAPRTIWFADNQSGLSTGESASYQVTVGAPAAEGQAVAAQAPTQLVQNGGFENATLAPWASIGDPGIDPVTRHSGAQSARLGGADFSDDELFQQLSIPADAAEITIDFWYRLATSEAFAEADSFCYGLWDSAQQQSHLERCKDVAAIGSVDWTQEVYTLTAGERQDVAGKSLLLYIYITTDFSDPSQVWVDDVALMVEGGEPSQPTVTPTETPPDSNPLRFTLSWIDYPGEPAGAKALVNDLDLEIVGPDGTRYSGNSGVYTGGQCLREARWDACNNTEGIFIANAAPGTYTVLIHGAQVAQGGRQPFALAGSGNNLKLSQVPTATPTTRPAQPPYHQYLPVIRR